MIAREIKNEIYNILQSYSEQDELPTLLVDFEGHLTLNYDEAKEEIEFEEAITKFGEEEVAECLELDDEQIYKLLDELDSLDGID